MGRFGNSLREDTSLDANKCGITNDTIHIKPTCANLDRPCIFGSVQLCALSLTLLLAMFQQLEAIL